MAGLKLEYFLSSASGEMRTAVITGATRGLGRELSFIFARSGYRVIGFFRANVSAAELMRKEFSQSGLAGEFIQHDITSEADDGVWQTVEDAENVTLINNACPSFDPIAFHLLRWEQFQTQIDGAVKGSFLCIQALLRKMVQQRRGTIVNVLTSALKDGPPKGFSAYLVGKAALRTLTESLAAEYADRGVRIFSVSPPYMKTDLTCSWQTTVHSLLTAQGTEYVDPALVAAYIFNLVESADVPGRGENYQWPPHTPDS